MVEGVVQLRAELQSRLFSKRERFSERHVPVVNAGANDRSAGNIAEGPESRVCESAGVKPLQVGWRGIVILDRPNLVGPVHQSVSGVAEITGRNQAKRVAGLEGCDSAELPAASDFVQDRIYVPAKVTSATKGKLKHIPDGEAVSGVESREAFLRLLVICVLRPESRGIVEVSIIIDRLGIGVSADKGEASLKASFQPHCACMIRALRRVFDDKRKRRERRIRKARSQRRGFTRVIQSRLVVINSTLSVVTV